MADDRLTGWRKSEVEDFYDLIDEKLIREDELDADYVDRLADRSATVLDLAEDTKSWRFGHVIVDEAQELSPMQWRMINRRSHNGSVTIVGDLAQRSAGAVAGWKELLAEAYGDYKYCELSINYRSPKEVNDVAGKVLGELGVDLPQAKAIRSSGLPVKIVKAGTDSKVSEIVEQAAAKLEQAQRLAVIVQSSDQALAFEGAMPDSVQLLTAEQSKGLEFDSVVVVGVDEFATDNALSDLYVAVTRSTNELVMTYSQELPGFLAA